MADLHFTPQTSFVPCRANLTMFDDLPYGRKVVLDENLIDGW